MHKLARVAGGSVLLALVVGLPNLVSSRPYESVDADGFAAGARPAPLQDTGVARVTVNPAAVLGTLPSTAFGLNMAVWDGHFLDPIARALVRQAGITLLRFPGGSTSDIYHWASNSLTPHQGSYADPHNTFDAFMRVARQMGAQALITVNYGSNVAGTGGGSPREAAAWVRYANRIKRYGVTYWEIGNEIYGPWETNLWPDKSPRFYATEAVRFATLMKAQDPSIKVGVPVWIDNDGFSHWNTTVLPMVCPHVDFVDVHYYPEEPRRESDAHLLASTNQIAVVMATLRADIARYCGPNAGRIRVIAGELNSTSRNPGKQTVGLPNALFLADSYMTWLEHGAVSVAWWVLHLGIRTHNNNSPLLYGHAAYGDMGILSNGSSDGVVREPPANTPFPPYYGLRMLTKVGRPGERMIVSRSDRRLPAVHAVARHSGDLSVLLINKDRARTYRVSVSLARGAAITHATAFVYGMTSPSIRPWPTGHDGRMITVIVPPYTLATVVLEHA